MGGGCLADQLLGQYLAHLADLGPLLETTKIRRALHSIRKYNHKKSMDRWPNVARAFALNDEAALVLFDYPDGKRPSTPFPYFTEAWTGIEYTTAALMIFEGMIEEGVDTVINARRRHDGEKRNPWNEQEAGHHYARAMAAWSTLVALSGFSYHAGHKHLAIKPRVPADRVSSFWSTGHGWGDFVQTRDSGAFRLTVKVTEGELTCGMIDVAGSGGDRAHVSLAGNSIAHEVKRRGADIVIGLSRDITVPAGQALEVIL